MFESMQEGVTPEQRALLNASCQSYPKNYKMVKPKDAWWVDPATGFVNVGGNFLLGSEWKSLLGIRFGKIGGYFNVVEADLKDASELPREIETHLNAGGNKFRTLEGIGYVKKTISVENNLLVSLEGLTKDLMGTFIPPSSKISAADRNPVRSGFLRDDLDEVLRGWATWTGIYLSIVAGDYTIKKDPDGSIEWILKNKLSPEVLSAEIKKAPEKMAIELAKVPAKHRKTLNGILDQIRDLPPGFKEDTDLVADLSDIGL